MSGRHVGWATETRAAAEPNGVEGHSAPILQAITEFLAPLTARLGALEDTIINRSQTQQQLTGPVPAKKLVRCFKCKETGHFKRDCPSVRGRAEKAEAKDQSATEGQQPGGKGKGEGKRPFAQTGLTPPPSQTGGSSAERSVRCYKCKQTGHIKKECPTRSRVGKVKGKDQGEGHQQQDFEPQPLRVILPPSQRIEQPQMEALVEHRQSAEVGQGSDPAMSEQASGQKQAYAIVARDYGAHAVIEGGICNKYMSTSSEQARKEYAEFEEKVKRTVLLDNLSPQVTSVVIETALGQFGAVVNVEFLLNYTIPYPVPLSALVEMETQKQARAVVAEMTNYPFMMSGMPRPVRAQAATAEMFSDRPSLPDRKIQVRWVDPSDPDYEIGMQTKELCKRNNAETLALIKLRLEEEEKLAKQQGEVLKAQYNKYEMIESLMQDSSVPRLARKYGLNLALDEDGRGLD